MADEFPNRDELLVLASKTHALDPSNRLILAAALIEQGLLDLAEPIIETVLQELTLLKLFPPTKGARAGAPRD
jgi:hypothetical protein